MPPLAGGLVCGYSQCLEGLNVQVAVDGKSIGLLEVIYRKHRLCTDHAIDRAGIEPRLLQRALDLADTCTCHIGFTQDETPLLVIILVESFQAPSVCPGEDAYFCQGL